MISSYEEKLKRNKIIKDENPIYSWSYLDRPVTWRDEFKKSGSILLGINLVLFVFISLPEYIFTIVKDGDYTLEIFIYLFFNIFGFLFMRYLALANILYEYDVKNSGIHCRYTQDIPEVCYQVARGIGWFGVLVCFIALFYIGPLAFFGMGASALLSFKQINFRKETQEEFVYFDDHMTIFNIDNSSKFFMTGNPDCINQLLFRTNEKELTIKNILSNLNKFDIYNVEREKDCDKHPAMIEIVEKYRFYKRQEISN